jgi:outer membrane protein assembly factor BamB
MSRLIALFAVLFITLVPSFAANWPGWRGPDGDGRSAEKEVPLRWSATEHVRWKAPLPEGGNSSPIVWGQRVFITQALEKGTRRAVMCFDRADGKLLWQKETLYQNKESTHAENPYCSATPVTDGRRVIASFGSAGMVCYDFSGRELWRKDLGKLEHIWGNASSPFLCGDLAILWCGPGERQFLLAVDKTSGETVWEYREPGGNKGADKDANSWVGSWSTPIIVPAGDHDELVLCVPEKVKAFDPRTGKELWSCGGLSKLVYTSPIHAQGIVVAMSGFHGPAMAVRTGGTGEVTETHRLWRHTEKIPQRIGSAVMVGEHVYHLNENGQAQCFALRTGDELWINQRLSADPSWGSLVAAAGRLYVTNKTGETFVLRADPKFELLAKNKIDERVLASLAVADGELFIRSYNHLWCIREKK